jgi:hypothetical protein
MIPVQPETGLSDLVPMCSTRPRSAWLYHGSVRQLCLLPKELCCLIYVDNSLVAGASNCEMEQVKEALKSEFKLNDLGTPRSFLGIQFDFHREGSVSIHQHH